MRVFSADHYFTVDGVYRFNPAQLPEAHQSCFAGYCSYLQATKDAGRPVRVLIMRGVPGSGKSTWVAAHACPDDVVVDNTNVLWEHAVRYWLVARDCGFETVLVTVECAPEVAAARNAHGVPASSVMAMHARLIADEANIPATVTRLGVHVP